MQNANKQKPVAILLVLGLLLPTVTFVFLPQIFFIGLIAGSFLIAQAIENRAKSGKQRIATVSVSPRRRVLVGLSGICLILAIGLALVSTQLMYSALFAGAVVFLCSVFWPTRP